MTNQEVLKLLFGNGLIPESAIYSPGTELGLVLRLVPDVVRDQLSHLELVHHLNFVFECEWNCSIKDWFFEPK
jgi:hypothetical protein